MFIFTDAYIYTCLHIHSYYLILFKFLTDISMAEMKLTVDRGWCQIMDLYDNSWKLKEILIREFMWDKNDDLL
jgi:hypothetical protein